MGKQVAKKITWAIKNFSPSRPGKIYSEKFIVGGCKWRFLLHPKGNNVEYLFLYLEVANDGSLSPGWRRQARYFLNIVKQNWVKRSKQNEEQKWFDVHSPRWGHLSMFPLNEFSAKDSGFLVNGELNIVAEIEVLEVIGNLDVSEDTSTILETMEVNGKFDVLEEISTKTESMEVNGFHLPPSQVGFVCHMFKRHPDIASEFRFKNPNLRKGYMSVLLSLIKTLRQSPQELHQTDLTEAYAALGFMTDAGFKLDWLEKKLVQMSEKKEKEEAGETRMQEMKKELKGLKLRCSDLEAQLEKEKAEVIAAKAPLSFDDVL